MFSRYDLLCNREVIDSGADSLWLLRLSIPGNSESRPSRSLAHDNTFSRSDLLREVGRVDLRNRRPSVTPAQVYQ
jgi:hypothetical protein